MDRPVAAIMSFVAGFVDTATFVGISGIFSAHITGNLILFAISVSKGIAPSDYLKLLVFPVFILGVVLATLIHDAQKKRGIRGPVRVVIAVMVVLLGVSSAASYWFIPETVRPDAVSPLQGMIVMIIVFAMGMQNSCHQFSSKTGGLTTVMTGNVTKLTIGTVRIWRGKRRVECVAVHRQARIEAGILIASFFLGCAVSAFLTLRWGLVSIAIPSVFLLISLLLLKDEGASNA